jgi:hypothetical protein
LPQLLTSTATSRKKKKTNWSTSTDATNSAAFSQLTLFGNDLKCPTCGPAMKLSADVLETEEFKGSRKMATSWLDKSVGKPMNKSAVPAGPLDSKLLM